MEKRDNVFNKIAEALLIDYSSVYYVNTKTNEYQWYSIDPEFNSLQIEKDGNDFFKNMARDAEQVVYEEDKHIFQQYIQKEKLLNEVKSGRMRSIVYRLMIGGNPVYHTLRLIREVKDGDDYFIFGVMNVDKEIRMKQEAEKLEKEREIFNQIAGSLAERYDTLYYIDIENFHYFEFSSTETYKRFQVPESGDDFFEESRKYIKKFIHPEDQEKLLNVCVRETMLKNLENRNAFSITYRVIVDGETVHMRHTEIWASDKKHIIVCLENINAEVIAERVFNENQKNSITYSQIAESLAAHYDVIYYVNTEDGSYAEFMANNIYGNLEMQRAGKDFFAEAIVNAEGLVYPEDKDRVLTALGRDYLLSALEGRKQYKIDYRLMVNGKLQYTRFTVMWSSDKTHFIICVENTTEEVLKEEEYLQALRSANELARRDELTGAKNKNAYKEMEDELQKRLDHGVESTEFAIIVCDLNNLKKINDTLGHKAGDAYIRSSSKMLFDTFSHSPVFRVGGDEFVVVLTGRDYEDREHLFENLRKEVLANREKGDAPVIATGLSEYLPEKDKKIAEVFERADNMMYANKKELKGVLGRFLR